MFVIIIIIMIIHGLKYKNVWSNIKIKIKIESTKLLYLV